VGDAAALLTRAITACDGAQAGDKRSLLGSRREPLEIGDWQHCIEHHQSLDGQARRHPTTIGAGGFADGVVQRLVMQVIEPRSIVDAADVVRVAAPDEPAEERVTPPSTVGDASEARVLTWDANAAVAQDEHDEPRLALGEAEVDDGLDAFLVRHRHNSSANPRGRLPLPPLRPRTQGLRPR
jgi:hypothetical protein